MNNLRNRTMSRPGAIARAEHHFDTGGFRADLARRVAIPTESQNPDRAAELARYIDAEMQPALEALGFCCRASTTPRPGCRSCSPSASRTPRCRPCSAMAMATSSAAWTANGSKGLSPWRSTADRRPLYGRGTADNKGQHTINFAALAAVLQTRGRLGFNANFLIEMGEEIGSPGLREFCAATQRAPSRPTC